MTARRDDARRIDACAAGAPPDAKARLLAAHSMHAPLIRIRIAWHLFSSSATCDNLDMLHQKNYAQLRKNYRTCWLF